jgi:hypothetical protein
VKNRVRRFIIRSTPMSVAVSPFEFAFLASYLAPAVKVLLEVIRNTPDPTIKALPFTGDLLTAWVAFILLGSLFGCAGILLQSFRKSTVTGLQLERGGLFLFGSAITAYVAGIAELVGWQSLNQSLISLTLLLAACAYKILQIGQALEALESRGQDR